MRSGNLAINPTLHGKMPYDVANDFTPIAFIAQQPVVVVVRTESPYETLAELIKASQAKDGGLTMASASNGTVGHLAGEVDKALGKPDTIARLIAEGSTAMSGTPEQLAAFLKAENTRWGGVVRDAAGRPR